MQTIELGRIKSVQFGIGGYQDSMIGFTFILGNKEWGTSDFWGAWCIKRPENSVWSEDSRIQALGQAVMRVNALLSEIGKQSLSDLEGTPVSVTFENHTLKTWRILTEVL